MDRPPQVRPGQVLLAFLGTGAVLGGLLWWVGPGVVLDLARGLGGRVLVLALSLQTLLSVLTALRIHLLLRGPTPGGTGPRFRDSLALAVVHSAVLLVAPWRTGELAYVFLARTVAGVPPPRALSHLVLLRLGDGAALSAVTVALLLAERTRVLPPVLAPLIGAVGMGAAAVVAITVGVTVGGSPFLAFVARQLRSLPRVAAGVQQAAQGLELPRREAAWHGILALLTWIAVLVSGVVVLGASGVDLSPALLAVLLAVQRYLLVVPLPALGTFGPMELSWAALVVPLGVPREVAVASMMGLHLLVACWAGIQGVVGAAFLAGKLRRT